MGNNKNKKAKGAKDRLKRTQRAREVANTVRRVHHRLITRLDENDKGDRQNAQDPDITSLEG